MSNCFNKLAARASIAERLQHHDSSNVTSPTCSVSAVGANGGRRYYQSMRFSFRRPMKSKRHDPAPLAGNKKGNNC